MHGVNAIEPQREGVRASRAGDMQGLRFWSGPLEGRYARWVILGRTFRGPTRPIFLMIVPTTASDGGSIAELRAWGNWE